MNKKIHKNITDWINYVDEELKNININSKIIDKKLQERKLKIEKIKKRIK